MKTLNEIKELPNLMIQHIAVDGGLGVLFKAGKSFATVVWSNGGGWEHVSISPFKRSYTPTWDEMCKPKITTAAFSVKNGDVVRFPEDISIMTAEQLGKHGHWITDEVEFYKLLNEKGVPLEKQPYLTSDCVACSECLRVINCMDNCMEDAMYCKYCGAKNG